MESSVLGPATIAIGAIIAAVIAGSFSYLNLINSKEQKVSEFRQVWIDSLRSSISEYITNLTHLSHLYKFLLEKKEKDDHEMFKETSDIYSKVNSTYNDIIFRINPDEEDKDGKQLNDNFLTALESTRTVYNEMLFTEAQEKCEELRKATKPLLKYEWKRVRNGEPSYKRAKKISAIILTVGLFLAFLGLGLIFYSYYQSSIKQEQASRKPIQPATKALQVIE